MVLVLVLVFCFFFGGWVSGRVSSSFPEMAIFPFILAVAGSSRTG